jgi:hypothetical protein
MGSSDRIGGGISLGTAGTTSEKGLNVGARVKNPEYASSLGISILEYLYLLRCNCSSHMMKKILLVLFLIIKFALMCLGYTMGSTVHLCALAGIVDQTQLLLASL